MGRDLALPVVVVRGANSGPILGVTAVVHGNELNGIPIIHRFVSRLRPSGLCGTVVAVPVVNIPAFLDNRREFRDGQDLNRLMPGKEPGNESQVYAHRFITRLVRHFEYLVDLHTASFGRANSLYVRADLHDPVTANMAQLIGPQIIVHNEGADGTLRAAAGDMGIHAITVEVGDPNRFQAGLIRSSRLGLEAVLEDLKMMPPSNGGPDDDETVVCSRSYWIYSDIGGILQVLPKVATMIEKDEPIAHLTDMFGRIVGEYRAPETGIVVGKSVNPVAHTGARVLHLGIPQH